MFARTNDPIASKVFAAALLAAVVVCATPGLAAEQAVAPETNPPGDIPDTQVFVAYTSPLGFTINVPEGWARANNADAVEFSDKYNTVDLSISTQTQPSTKASAMSIQVPQLASTDRAVKVVEVKDVKVAGGNAVLIAYTSNSDPNPVTTKQIRLEHNLYLFQRGSTLATLDMAAPQGADNVDAWLMMANSFRWK